MIDGPVLVAEALDAGVRLESVFVEQRDDGSVAPEIAAVADRAEAAGATRHELAPRVLSGAVDTITPNGIAAVGSIRTRGLEQAVDATETPVLVLAGVSDPGNAGTLLRAAEAAGVTAVVATAGSVDLFSPKAVRASAGSVFRLRISVGDDERTVLDVLRRMGKRCIGTTVDGPRSYDEADLVTAVAIVLGNEAHGLDPDLLAALDETIAIPMEGDVESLNVAMAGTLVLFEAARQRRARS